MSRTGPRVHDQIVDLLTKAHTEQDSLESRIKYLQQAMEHLLYHNATDEGVDEFLETFLSMHVDGKAPIRRFCAHFIEMLVFTRSRYACSCLEVLISLLQDTDKQVVIFSLRAARVVYKRALYWISIQQRESAYLLAARESVGVLDHLLARIVHLITSSNREVFCESIRCAQTIVLCQSFSSFAPRSMAQLEAVGGSSLEDLKLSDYASTASAASPALDELKLKAQADRIFAALCALLLKNREHVSESVALIHAVGVVGHERSSYIGAATVAFSQVVLSGTENPSLKTALICELKRILSSRHCIEWQPQIVPILTKLGIIVDENIVLESELERMKDQLKDDLNDQEETSGTKKLQKTGAELLEISRKIENLKVPDEDHAAAVCSVRATSPAELASLSLAMLSRLVKRFPNPSMALLCVNRSTSQKNLSSVSFEHKRKAIRQMGIISSDFLADDELMDDTKDDEEEALLNSVPSETEALGGESSTVDIAAPLASIGKRNPRLFTKLVLGFVKDPSLIGGFIEGQFSASNVDGIVDLFWSPECDLEWLGSVLVDKLNAAAQAESFGPFLDKFRTIMFSIPKIPSSILDYLKVLGNDETPPVRRWALTTISSLIVSKPGVSEKCLEILICDLCSSQNESVRTDALKLLITKIYKPDMNRVVSWPYDELPLDISRETNVEASKLANLLSETVEKFSIHVLEKFGVIWPFFALIAKKPILIHLFFSHILESTDVAVIPNELLVSLAGCVDMDRELDLLITQHKSVRAVAKKKKRNEFILPILSAISNTERGLTKNLADAALLFSK